MNAKEAVRIHNGFMTGVECNDFSERDSVIYMMGVANGIILSPLYGTPEPCAYLLGACLERKTNYQLGATFRKYIIEHPEEWHEGCHNLASNALLRLCPREQNENLGRLGGAGERIRPHAVIGEFLASTLIQAKEKPIKSTTVSANPAHHCPSSA